MSEAKFVIKIKALNGEAGYLADGTQGNPPRAFDVKDAVVFQTEIEAVRRALRLGRIYPFCEFSVVRVDELIDNRL